MATTSNRGGQTGQIRTTSYVFNDYTNQRTAVFFNSTDSSGKQYFYEVLTIFNVSSSTGKLYILNLITKGCSVINTDAPISKYCVPDTAQKLGDVTLGANSESLPVSVFANIFDDLLVQFTFTQKLCIPVSQLTIANEGPATLVNVAAFANIKTFISQPSVFTVPPECKKANEMFAPEASFMLQFASMPPNMFSIIRPFL